MTKLPIFSSGLPLWIEVDGAFLPAFSDTPCAPGCCSVVTSIATEPPPEFFTCACSFSSVRLTLSGIVGFSGSAQTVVDGCNNAGYDDGQSDKPLMLCRSYKQRVGQTLPVVNKYGSYDEIDDETSFACSECNTSADILNFAFGGSCGKNMFLEWDCHPEDLNGTYETEEFTFPSGNSRGRAVFALGTLNDPDDRGIEIAHTVVEKWGSCGDVIREAGDTRRNTDPCRDRTLEIFCTWETRTYVYEITVEFICYDSIEVEDDTLPYEEWVWVTCHRLYYNWQVSGMQQWTSVDAPHTGPFPYTTSCSSAGFNVGAYYGLCCGGRCNEDAGFTAYGFSGTGVNTICQVEEDCASEAAGIGYYYKCPEHGNRVSSYAEMQSTFTLVG